jgi:hypothetical protein
MLLIWLVGCTSYSSETATPKRPQEVNVPFDVSHSNRSIVVDVKIAEHRSYNFDLAVYYKDDVDLYRVMQLTGNGSQSLDGPRSAHPGVIYGHPGVIIPLHVKVISNSGAVIYDHIQDVQGIDGHTFLKNHSGYFSRSIGGVDLRPDVYRIEVNTIKDTPEFFNEHCSLLMGWQPNTAPLDN